MKGEDSETSAPYHAKLVVLQVVAPFQTIRLKVAGLHRAFPSAALDKSLIQLMRFS